MNTRLFLFSWWTWVNASMKTPAPPTRIVMGESIVTHAEVPKPNSSENSKFTFASFFFKF